MKVQINIYVGNQLPLSTLLEGDTPDSIISAATATMRGWGNYIKNAVFAECRAQDPEGMAVLDEILQTADAQEEEASRGKYFKEPFSMTDDELQEYLNERHRK
ncbi:MAG: hypothetical protein IIB17_11060 [Chloroflexi bacterium]|nr:hypothetical protein [Chloroflexota bacterium]